MNRNQLLTEALRALSDPKTMEALQTAATPFLGRLEDMRVKAATNGTDPLTALYEMFGQVTSQAKEEVADKEESKPTVTQDEVELAISTFKVQLGNLFVHKKTGRLYVLVSLTNTLSTDQVKFPTSVSYLDPANNTIWSRPIIDFAEKFVKYA